MMSSLPSSPAVSPHPKGLLTARQEVAAPKPYHITSWLGDKALYLIIQPTSLSTSWLAERASGFSWLVHRVDLFRKRPAYSWSSWVIREEDFCVVQLDHIHLFDCFCTLNGSRILSESSVDDITGYCPRAWVGIFRTYLPIQAAITLSIDACDQAPHILPKMQVHQSLTVCWHSFSRWCRERFASVFRYTGGQYYVYGYV